jgi:hypothetical protein
MIRTAMIFVLSLVLPAAAIAAPARLTDSQMDFVTAGLTVDTSASASASGNDAKGKATATNRVFGGGLVTIGIGRAKSSASACCGDEADVAATTSATGEGDIVKSRNFSFEFETRNGKKVAKSSAFVLVIEFNRDGLFAGR